MTSFKPAYGPVFDKLLEVDRCRALDAGSPSAEDENVLSALTVNAAFAHTTIRDPQMAKCCLSAIWLLYDFLEESHTISQSIPSAEGSFLHGIMHRREGDFSNAKYWFRKVGQHPIYEQLAKDELCEHEQWDPYLFVDECQRAFEGRGDEQRCRQLQQREWELLFDHCLRLAVDS